MAAVKQCFCIRKDCDCKVCNQTVGSNKDYIQEIHWPDYGTSKASRKIVGHVVNHKEIE